MGLQDTDLAGTISSEDTNLLEVFYIPTLSVASHYRRAVGYFSAAMLCHAAEGLSALFANGGKFQLIIGDPLDDEEYESIKRGHDLQRIYSRLDHVIDSAFSNAEHPLFQDRLNLLSALVAHGRLEIKIALRRRGMYHDKSGIIEDSGGSKIAFSGSANETAAALLPEFNVESLFIYPSWNNEIYKLYGEPIERRFERIWCGEAQGIVTVGCPSKTYEEIAKRQTTAVPIRPSEEITKSGSVQSDISVDPWPRLPTFIGNTKYKLRAHQQEALTAWRAYDYQGILAHATGSGKTITALHGTTKIADYHRSHKQNLVIIVAVPYKVLAEQWVKEFYNFGVSAIRCFGSRNEWHERLDHELSDIHVKTEAQFIAIVAVNATLASENFQKHIRNINRNQILLLGDECHHHTSDRWKQVLPCARYRLGLSATPYNSDDDERANKLRGLYGPVVSTYGIKDALHDGVLSPYAYYPEIITLTEEEAEAYEDLTSEIASLYAALENQKGASRTRLDALLGKRARLIGSAENKFHRLDKMISEQQHRPHTLFYCGDGSTELEEHDTPIRDIERIAEILDEHGWKSSRFTAEETRSERERILTNFTYEYIDAIVAIRVLDEGFDMPSCESAFLLASTRNPRQYVQRRGRILRPTAKKKQAYIHDFIVTPPRSHRSSAVTKLVQNELLRGAEFARLSNNYEQATTPLKELGLEYDLDYTTIERDAALMEIEIG